MKVAKLDGTKIINIALAETVQDGWTDLTAYPVAKVGGHIIEGNYVKPAKDPRMVLDGEDWVFPIEGLYLANAAFLKAKEPGGMTTGAYTHMKLPTKRKE